MLRIPSSVLLGSAVQLTNLYRKGPEPLPQTPGDPQHAHTAREVKMYAFLLM